LESAVATCSWGDPIGERVLDQVLARLRAHLLLDDGHRCDASDVAEREMAAWREILDGAKGRSGR